MPGSPIHSASVMTEKFTYETNSLTNRLPGDLGQHQPVDAADPGVSTVDRADPRCESHRLKNATEMLTR